MDFRQTAKIEKAIADVDALQREVSDIKDALAQLIIALARVERTQEQEPRNGADRHRRAAGSN